MAYQYDPATGRWADGGETVPPPAPPTTTGQATTAPIEQKACDDATCNADCKGQGYKCGACKPNGTCQCSNNCGATCAQLGKACTSKVPCCDPGTCINGICYDCRAPKGASTKPCACGGEAKGWICDKNCTCPQGKTCAAGKCGTGGGTCGAGADCMSADGRTKLCDCDPGKTCIQNNQGKWRCGAHCSHEGDQCDTVGCCDGEALTCLTDPGTGWKICKKGTTHCGAQGENCCADAPRCEGGLRCCGDGTCKASCGGGGNCDAPLGSGERGEDCPCETAEDCSGQLRCVDGKCADTGADPDGDYGNAPCITCKDDKDCPGGYECVTMSDGQMCCIPGQFKVKGDYKLYGYKWEKDANGEGHWTPCKVGEAGCSADITDIGENEKGTGHLQEAMRRLEELTGKNMTGEYDALLRELERFQGTDVTLKNYLGKGTGIPEQEHELMSRIMAMGRMPGLQLLQPGQDVTGLGGLMTQQMSQFLERPKGYSAEEESQILQRMRGQIGEEYRLAGEENMAQLGERGLMESGLGAYTEGQRRNLAAQGMSDASRDVAIENMMRKTSEQQAALGLGSQFLGQQQAFFTDQQKADMERQLEERGWTKDQIDAQMRALEGSRGFLSQQQQLDLEAQIQNTEQQWKGFDVRRAILGDEADWEMANKTLESERQQWYREMQLKGADFQLERMLAHQQLLAESAKFGLSIEEMEARINTERMKISQESTQTMLSYLLATIAAGGGG